MPNIVDFLGLLMHPVTCWISPR